MHIDFINYLKWVSFPSDRPTLTEEKIRSFRNLQPGWRYGEGVTIEEGVVLDVLELNNAAIDLGFFDTVATPIENGGISFLIIKENYDLEYVIGPERSINSCLTHNDEDIEEYPSLTLGQAIEHINKLWERQCAQSGYSSWVNTSHIEEDSTARQPLQIREMIQASPSWNVRAY